MVEQMESSDDDSWLSTLYIMATAVCIWAVIWRLKGGRVGYWAIACGAPLCVWGFPGYCGLLLICCSLWLLCAALGTRVEFVPMQGKAVLITGCDTGFGHALAKQLSDMGVTVFAGVLHEDSPGAQELRRHRSHGGELHVLQLNVTDCQQIDKAHQYINSQVGEAGLWGLVNNAGYLGCVTDGEIQPRTDYRRCLEVNYLAAVEMCQVFLPMLRRSRGRIVNVCSMAGEVPLLGFAAYAASKSALNMFSKVIRQELAGWGVKVAIIQPSGFRTNIFGNSEDWNRYQEEILSHLSPAVREDYGEEYISSIQCSFTKMADQSSEDLCPVLQDMCHALMSPAPKARYTPGRMAWLIPFLYRYCPAAVTDPILPHISKSNDRLPAGCRMN